MLKRNMAGVLGRREKRFSIDDAFEEENDEVIKVYGSTSERSPLKPKNRTLISEDHLIVHIDDSRDVSQTSRLKFTDDTLSQDSDSLMHEGYYSDFFDPSQSCWQHPKIKENLKMVLAACLLLIIGIGLLAAGVAVLFSPRSGLQGLVFFIAGSICFIPGAYHVVYIYLAVKGWSGYDFYHLPVFN